jgi:hypothetical protein
VECPFFTNASQQKQQELIYCQQLSLSVTTPNGDARKDPFPEEYPTTPVPSKAMSGIPAVPPILHVHYLKSLEDEEGPSVVMSSAPSALHYSRHCSSTCSTKSLLSNIIDDKEQSPNFFPTASYNFKWMGQSIESLLLRHAAKVPLLTLLKNTWEDEGVEHYSSQQRSTASTFGGGGSNHLHNAFWQRSSQGSFPGGRQGFLLLSQSNMHDGTLALYFNSTTFAVLRTQFGLIVAECRPAGISGF